MDLNERFEEVSAKMDELKAKAEKASREVKESWNEGIANFKSDMAFTMESINEVADEAEKKHDQKVGPHLLVSCFYLFKGTFYTCHLGPPVPGAGRLSSCPVLQTNMPPALTGAGGILSSDHSPSTSASFPVRSISMIMPTRSA